MDGGNGPDGLRVAPGLVPGGLAGDVGEERGEVGRLEELVEGDELQRRGAAVLERRREGPVRQLAQGLLRDDTLLLDGWVGEAVDGRHGKGPGQHRRRGQAEEDGGQQSLGTDCHAGRFLKEASIFVNEFVPLRGR